MAEKNIRYIAKPGSRINGEVRVPGDKSISHRSIMLGSLADGETRIKGFLTGADSVATLNAFREMGVEISDPNGEEIIIKGVGVDGLKAARSPLDLGNSGTSMRLLSGLLAGQEFDSVLIGDSSLSKRPMKRVTLPLKEMGSVIETTENGTAPLKISGNNNLKPISYDMPLASAQVKSCLLLAGIYAEGETTVIEPAPTRDHTERMLAGFSYKIDGKSGIKKDGSKVTICGGGRLQGCDIDVPADISSAAFFMVAATIARDSELLLQHVGINPTRTGVIDILKLMGADITLENRKEIGGEEIADIRVRSASLKGIDIPEELVPLAIDEFPVIFIAAAAAGGTTRLSGAEELRVKESDRIEVMVNGLQAVGIDAQGTPDGAVIVGGVIKGGRVHSHEDHRISMSFSIASLIAEGEIIIEDCANVETSFPGFVKTAQQLGVCLEEQAGEASK